MKKGKTTKGLKIPSPNAPAAKAPTLPYNSAVLDENGFSISFSLFERKHELFNLGGNSEDGTVGGKWFIDLLDCFKSVCGMTVDKLRQSTTHQLHPVSWEYTNAKPPYDSEQYEYYQFRISKSKGRVIGILLRGVFYVIWLDPYHNLTNSEGYGKVTYYSPALSIYETQKTIIEQLTEEKERLCREMDELLSQ